MEKIIILKELKSELIKIGYSFTTKSDTEVLLTAWQEWGEEFSKKTYWNVLFCSF